MRGRCGASSFRPGSGAEDDAAGAFTVPLYSVAPEVRGDVAKERFGACPLALTHPDAVPGVAQAFRLYKRIHRHEGRLLGDVSGLSVQMIDAVDSLELALGEIREAERERMRNE